MFARPLATPSLSFETPMPQAGASEPAAEPPASSQQVEVISAVLEAQRQMALMSIYYGVPTVNVIEISFREPAGEESRRAFPASITESGVTELTDAEALRHRGYGITLPEAAQLWKSGKRPAPRVYTNSDLERLRNGG
jgi:hypothetical protein